MRKDRLAIGLTAFTLGIGGLVGCDVVPAPYVPTPTQEPYAPELHFEGDTIGCPNANVRLYVKAHSGAEFTLIGKVDGRETFNNTEYPADIQGNYPQRLTFSDGERVIEIEATLKEDGKIYSDRWKIERCKKSGTQ